MLFVDKGNKGNVQNDMYLINTKDGTPNEWVM